MTFEGWTATPYDRSDEAVGRCPRCDEEYFEHEDTVCAGCGAELMGA